MYLNRSIILWTWPSESPHRVSEIATWVRSLEETSEIPFRARLLKVLLSNNLPLEVIKNCGLAKNQFYKTRAYFHRFLKYMTSHKKWIKELRTSLWHQIDLKTSRTWQLPLQKVKSMKRAHLQTPMPLMIASLSDYQNSSFILFYHNRASFSSLITYHFANLTSQSRS